MTKAYSILLLWIAACAVHADVDFLIWNQGRINRVSSVEDETTLTPLSPVTTFGYGQLWGDYDEQVVFFSAWGDYVGSAPMNGDPPTEDVIPNAVDTFTIDTQQKKLYHIRPKPTDLWPEPRQLFRTDYDGTNEILLADSLDAIGPDNLQIDKHNGKIYWKGFSADFSRLPPTVRTPFYRCNMDGTGLEKWYEPDFAPYTVPPGGDVFIAVDGENGKLYWVSGNEFHSVNLDNPSDTHRLASNPELSHSWSHMHFREGKLYGLGKVSDNHQIDAYDPTTGALVTAASFPFDTTLGDRRFGTMIVPAAGDNPAVAGGWGTWSEFGACDLACGGGTQSQSRQCDNPEPENGGAECTLLDKSSGLSETRSQSCNSANCAGNAYIDSDTSALCDQLYGAGATRGFKKDIQAGNCNDICDAAGLTCRMAVKIYPKPDRRTQLGLELYHVYDKGVCKTIYGNGCCCNPLTAK